MKRPTEQAAEETPPDPERLFRGLAGARGLVLAVSGGIDSSALMVLMARWTARPPLLVVSVDHGLRPGSADEARLVEANAVRLGLACRTMRAPRRETSGNLQDWARRARYACLAAAAAEAGFDAIVTAHHLDDQAETFLLRLARGSGVYGLAAMTAEGTASGVRLVRPLLGVPRRELAEIVLASGLASVDDPSNADPRFARVRMRALLPDLAEHGLSTARLGATAARLGRAAVALDHYSGELIRCHFRADRFGAVAGSAAALADAPEEVGLRALARILQAVGGADHTPRLDRLESLMQAIRVRGKGGRFARTLHGIVMTAEGDMLKARREWGRNGLPSVPAPARSTLIWDRRFRVSVPDAAGLSLGPLGRSQRPLRAKAADRQTMLALPGLFCGASLLAVPEEVVATDGGESLGQLAAESLVGPRLGLMAG